MIRVVLPFHLRNLARAGEEVSLDLHGSVTLGQLLLALESRYPVLKGTIRDHVTLKRRPFIRFFACKEDFSDQPLQICLPDSILNGEEPFLVVGAMAGG